MNARARARAQLVCPRAALMDGKHMYCIFVYCVAVHIIREWHVAVGVREYGRTALLASGQIHEYDP